jgi:hypothetical protein
MSLLDPPTDRLRVPGARARLYILNAMLDGDRTDARHMANVMRIQASVVRAPAGRVAFKKAVLGASAWYDP